MIGTGTHPQGSDFDAVVVGAGFSGLYMLHRLRGLGLRARVYEAGDGVGGTWYWNRYPGARCDVESVYYSYSFSPELEQDWEWSRRYPAQPEVLAYLNHVAERFDLRRDIQFDTRVSSACFEEDASRWVIHIDDGTGGGQEVSAQYLITAVGCLSTTNVPDFAGLDSFTGEWYHTGRWPRGGVDFTGRSVGLVGTGSTGIQIAPEIAKQAEQLTVFQRTANYTIPAQDRPLTEEESREVKADYPRLRERSRHTFAGLPLTPSEYSALEVRPDERERVYEQGWRKGGFHFLFSAYHDILFDSEANETAAEFVREKIRSIVDEPATAELLCPRDYPLGSKRLVTDTDYFVTFNRDNVRLVDVRSAPIQRITADGLETAGGHYALDAIVFATGFDAMTGSLLRMDIRGRGGVCLAERWADGIARNYLGLQVAGFPNMFTITGPGSPSVLSNMVLSIEQHVDWIAACLADMSRHGRSSIEATEAAEASWVEHQVQLTNATLFPQGDSWYLGANIPGKGRFFTPYPGGVGPYRKICDDVAGKGYEGFTFAA